MDERHQLTIEEYAVTAPEPFDVAFCIYVFEHVTDPPAFFESIAHLLKPGGSFFALTLNMHQYFGLITWAASRAGVAEAMLRRLRAEEDLEDHDHAHDPTRYRTNSIRSVSRFLSDAGFESVDFRCFEATRRYAWYLPGPLKPAATGYTRAAYAVRRPSLMGHLSFRAASGTA